MAFLGSWLVMMIHRSGPNIGLASGGGSDLAWSWVDDSELVLIVADAKFPRTPVARRWCYYFTCLRTFRPALVAALPGFDFLI
jgi:hypothetical protein